MRSNSFPELSNRIIGIGTNVCLGWLPPEKALQKLEKDVELSNLHDEQLQALIEETARYWREKLEGEVSNPQHIIIYPVLMSICAEGRLNDIYHLGKGATNEVKSRLNPRLAQWVTIFVRCLIDKGMALLLVPDAKRAWLDFERAYQQASVGLDAEHLSLHETLWARYGQLVAAQIANQEKETRVAKQELSRLMQLSRRRQDAEDYLEKIQLEFTRILEILKNRQELQREQELSSKFSLIDLKIDTISYLSLLSTYGHLILENRMKPEEAKQLLLGSYGHASFNLSLLSAKEIYFASLFHLQLAESEPVVAVILADLNYAVSCSYKGDKAELVRTECAYALGASLLGKARQLKGPERRYNYWMAHPQICAQAIPYLHEALAGFDSQDRSNDYVVGKAANTQAKLALCYNGIGNYEKAIEVSYDAVCRLEMLPDQRHDLGPVYGNLAAAQEQLGEDVAAFDNYYKAFQIFLETNKLVGGRKAISSMFRLCERIGRYDDAMAACERALLLSIEVADIEGAGGIYELMAKLAFGTHHFLALARILDDMHSMVLPHISEESMDPRYLPLYYQVLIWRGTIIMSANVTSEDLEEGYQALEKARKIALALRDEDRHDLAVLQLSHLFIATGALDRAEQYCNMIDLTSCPRERRAEHDANLGEIRFHQKRYKEAIHFFQQAIEIPIDSGLRRDKRLHWLQRIGEAHENLDDLEGAVQAYETFLNIFEQMRLNMYEESRMIIMKMALATYNKLVLLYSDSKKKTYNPKQGIYWLEKSKSRTFLETLGLSALILRDSTGEIQADLLEEKRLLQKLNVLRGRLSFGNEEIADRLWIQQEIYTYLKHLEGIWDKIALSNPEYVELRRGEVAEWDELQEMFEK